MIKLETDRLSLRGWHNDDLDALVAINADPEVMRYILDGSVRDRRQTAEGLQKNDQRLGGAGIRSVRRRGS